MRRRLSVGAMRAACAIVVGALTLGGCTSLVRQTTRAASASPWSLPPADQRLRDALTAGTWAPALRASSSEKDGAPSDRLLRDLYHATIAYYAGQWDSSSAAFGRAATLADDRYTKSLTRGALAIATNDLALPYVPGQNERLMLHYYGMQTWLRRGSAMEAAVEARRIAQLLAEFDGGENDADASFRATLRALTGAVFEAAGETEDAAVAYRNARALAGRSLPWDRDSATAARRGPASPDSGDVVVVIEQGFVAHRVEQRLRVRADDEAWEEDGRRRDALDGDAIRRATALFAGDDGLWASGPRATLTIEPPVQADSAPAPGAPVTAAALSAPPGAVMSVGSTSPTTRPARRRERTGDAWIELAWPAFRRPSPIGVVRWAAAESDSDAGASALRGNVSDALAGDFRRDRGVRLARLLARAATRGAATASLEKRHHELASVFRAVSDGIERADTRSWHLLPGAISVVRLRLAAGPQPISVLVDGDTVAVGTAHVPPGGMAFVTTRLWPGGDVTRASSPR